jgi:hypothetical protein
MCYARDMKKFNLLHWAMSALFFSSYGMDNLEDFTLRHEKLFDSQKTVSPSREQLEQAFWHSMKQCVPPPSKTSFQQYADSTSKGPPGFWKDFLEQEKIFPKFDRARWERLKNYIQATKKIFLSDYWERELQAAVDHIPEAIELLIRVRHIQSKNNKDLFTSRDASAVQNDPRKAIELYDKYQKTKKFYGIQAHYAVALCDFICGEICQDVDGTLCDEDRDKGYEAWAERRSIKQFRHAKKEDDERKKFLAIVDQVELLFQKRDEGHNIHRTEYLRKWMATSAWLPKDE